MKSVPLNLDAIKELDVDSVACFVHTDVRPFRGFASQIDWVLGGRLSALAKDAVILGDRGDHVLIEFATRLRLGHVVVVGLGAIAGFGDETFDNALAELSKILDGLSVRRCALELPGRAGDLVDYAGACERLERASFKFPELAIVDRAHVAPVRAA